MQLLYVDGDKQYPLFFGIHAKRGRKPRPQRERTAPIGKQAIALKAITQALACGFRPKALVFDGWYAAVCFLRALRRLSLSFISRLNSARILLINGCRIKAGELARKIRTARYYRRLKVRAFALTATLPNYGLVQVVVFKQRRKKPVILFTDLLDADLSTIIELYRQRWAIESWFREIKQRYGLDAFQHRTAARIIAHLVLTLPSYLLVVLLQQFMAAVRKCKAKELFTRLFRITAMVTAVDGILNIIVGNAHRLFRTTIRYLNRLQIIPSTA